ncbi:MAG: sulfite exporter TauE/SafE family protein [Gammaproteobacteria bacterium]
MEAFFAYPLIGIGAGILGGLLGVGGGIVIVPALVWIFHANGFPENSIMHMAIGTSLATILPTSLASVRAHHKHQAVQWRVFLRLSPGFGLGALLGAIAATYIASGQLRLLFGVFLCLVAMQLTLGSAPAPHRELPGRNGLLAVGTLIGMLSALLGIGGGNLTVPFLLHCRVPIRQAIATGAAAGMPIATIATVGYIVAGQYTLHLPAWSIGYVYGPAWVGIATMSVLFAPLGAKLAHRLPTVWLRRGFGLFLMIVGLRMLGPVVG